MIEFDQKSYDLLISCERKNDFSEWNKFLQKNKKAVNLDGADFTNWNFKTCDFLADTRRKVIL